MTSTSQLDQYRLETIFDEDGVVHTYKIDLAADQERLETKEKWRHKQKIGAGGFGVVWLQEEEGGKVRAVKQLPRDARNANYSRELATLAQVKDVSAPRLLVSGANSRLSEPKFVCTVYRLVRKPRFYFCCYGVYRTW